METSTSCCSFCIKHLGKETVDVSSCGNGREISVNGLLNRPVVEGCDSLQTWGDVAWLDSVVSTCPSEGDRITTECGHQVGQELGGEEILSVGLGKWLN